jgi:hypothetical protein
LFRENPQVFLEMTVEGTTLTPRRRLESAPFAALAEHAEHAATADSASDTDAVGGVPAGDVYSTSNAPSVQDLRNGGYSGNNGITVDSTNADIELASCSNGEVYRYNGASGSWGCAPSPGVGGWCANGMPVGMNMDGSFQCEQIESTDIGMDQVGANEADTDAITSTIGVCTGDLDYLYGVNNSGRQCRSFKQTQFSRINGELVIASSAVDTANLAQDAVEASKISSNTITDGEIASGAVKNSELGTDAVQNSNIDDDAVSDDNIDYGCGSEYLELRGCAGFNVDTALNQHFPTCDQVGVGDVCKEGSQNCITNATNVYDQNGNSSACSGSFSNSVQLYIKKTP